jgi:hypothetical protein
MDSDKNFLIISTGETSNLANSIEFLFPNENFSLKPGETAPLSENKKPAIWARTFYILNKSKDSIIKINSIEMAEGKSFSVRSQNSLPVLLYPGQITNDNYFALRLETTAIENGNYYDQVIINGNPQLSFFINVEVKQ